jgi:histidine triad (HIT) family protein
MACIFCDIVAGKIPAAVVYSGPNVTAIRDINPQAPAHILLMPNRHVSGIADLTDADRDLLGELISLANQIAREEGIAEGGYRLVVNQGRNGGQTVPHLHVHLLGGRPMTWPPG